MVLYYMLNLILCSLIFVKTTPHQRLLFKSLFYFFFLRQIETLTGHEIDEIGHNRSCEASSKGYMYTIILAMRDQRTLRKKGQKDFKSQNRSEVCCKTATLETDI